MLLGDSTACGERSPQSPRGTRGHFPGHAPTSSCSRQWHGTSTAPPALLHHSHWVPVPAPSTLVTVTGRARPGSTAPGALHSPGTPTEPQCNWHAWGAAAGGDTAQNTLETCLGCRGSLQKWAAVEFISELKLRSQKAQPQSTEAEKRHGSAFALAHGEDLADAAGVSFHLKNWEK